MRSLPWLASGGLQKTFPQCFSTAWKTYTGVISWGSHPLLPRTAGVRRKGRAAPSCSSTPVDKSVNSIHLKSLNHELTVFKVRPWLGKEVRKRCYPQTVSTAWKTYTGVVFEHFSVDIRVVSIKNTRHCRNFCACEPDKRKRIRIMHRLIHRLWISLCT